jgi:hypothetical protein
LQKVVYGRISMFIQRVKYPHPFRRAECCFFIARLCLHRDNETFHLPAACCRLARIMPHSIFKGFLLEIRAEHKIRRLRVHMRLKKQHPARLLRSTPEL